MVGRRRCRLCIPLFGGFLLALAVAQPSLAADPEWLLLRAPSFGVVSQLREEDTREWAAEFEQFIDALHQLYNVESVELPPLTIVLFKQPKGFAPYRIQTASGQAEVDGFFGNRMSWSVIGLAGTRDEDRTRGVVYHEAVHWFMSASDTSAPLWFKEGLAETLSTFNIKDGKARWGEGIEEHVGYLRFAGLAPMDEFLRSSQDEALHGRDSDTYYPQAWLFVHYLLFGNGGVDRAKLQVFLKGLRETDLDTAFAEAFAKSYDEVTEDLRAYVRRGRYSQAEQELQDHSDEMTVAPATPAQVEFALARLATAGDNYDLATAHIDKVIGLAPGAPSGYEMRALVANETGDDAGFAAAVDRAIELGSRDAVIYMLKAEQVIRDNEQENAAWDDFLPPGPARTAADLYARAIGLLPRNREAYAGLINALLNVDSVTEADQIMLRGGRMLLPTDGLLLVGEAAIEKQRGNEQQAVELLRQARAAPFTLQARFRPAVAALHADWLSRYVFDQFQAHIREGRLDAAQALLSEQLSGGELPQGVRTRFERLQRDALGLERILAAGSAVEAGDVTEARAILTALLNDTQTTPTVRRMAEDRIANLPGGGARPPN